MKYQQRQQQQKKQQMSLNELQRNEMLNPWLLQADLV